MNVRETKIATSVAKCQSFVINAQLVKHRGVQIMNFDRILKCVLANFVGHAMDMTFLEASTS